MKELLGKKLGMTRIFDADGDAIPVTVIETGPCVVVDKKRTERDGYDALRVGFGEKRKNLFTKPELGLYEKAGVEPRRYLREINFEGEYNIGQELTVDLFKKGEKVDINRAERLAKEVLRQKAWKSTDITYLRALYFVADRELSRRNHKAALAKYKKVAAAIKMVKAKLPKGATLPPHYLRLDLDSRYRISILDDPLFQGN